MMKDCQPQQPVRKPITVAANESRLLDKALYNFEMGPNWVKPSPGTTQLALYCDPHDQAQVVILAADWLLKHPTTPETIS